MKDLDPYAIYMLFLGMVVIVGMICATAIVVSGHGDILMQLNK